MPKTNHSGIDRLPTFLMYKCKLYCANFAIVILQVSATITAAAVVNF